tara:strand:+ start:824 stop:1402 length:579 start_codon:yes stop_codon:yes gene_type:complete
MKWQHRDNKKEDNKLKSKTMGITPDQRKKKVADLREEHEDYFQTEGKINALYIPKMAYRPGGKDELHISFFPSELEKEENIYTEFVSISYDSEDPKRTLYLLKHNPHWREEFELSTSSSGFQRHLVPVSELKVINDVTNRGKLDLDFADLPNPDTNKLLAGTASDSSLVDKLEEINQTLKTLTKVINNKLNK